MRIRIKRQLILLLLVKNKVSEYNEVAGDNQAASRLGDESSGMKDVRIKTYANCVRLNMGQFKKFQQKLKKLTN